MLTELKKFDIKVKKINSWNLTYSQKNGASGQVIRLVLDLLGV